ncbi:serine/threonine-protein kinase CTR1 isoform X2 [Cryptomeria japonica]|uniref:serine/threonine-protein kinase CTR1 isoform X2 n=1 Tax=Cryptomeria japonica TaxID=3369 RepID=UPI0025ACEB82|nr:serine/threonine-protein kinase CTR1 isoform X2 [Cryptomeria japonica]
MSQLTSGRLLFRLTSQDAGAIFTTTKQNDKNVEGRSPLIPEAPFLICAFFLTFHGFKTEAAHVHIMDQVKKIEVAAGSPGPSEMDASSSSNCCSLQLVQKMQSIVLDSRGESPNTGFTEHSLQDGDISPQIASEILWKTGTYDYKIPNGFYSVIPIKTLKEQFDTIPSPEELSALGPEGVRADAILVDSEKDIKLAKLKELTVALVKGLSSNPALIIRKIAEVVSDFYGGPVSEAGVGKYLIDDGASLADSFEFQLLGKIKNGLCRPRAMLFKVLADAVGLRSKLLVGLQVYDKVILQADPDRHMSLLVGLNSTELLVDVMRSPGQLIPFSVKSLIMHHFSGAVESDSADYDSCDSPLEPSSPMFGVSEKYYSESVSKSEPDIANFFLRRSRRKSIGECHTTNSRVVCAMNEAVKRERCHAKGLQHVNRDKGICIVQNNEDIQDNESQSVAISGSANQISMSSQRKVEFGSLKNIGKSSQEAPQLPSCPIEYKRSVSARSSSVPSEAVQLIKKLECKSLLPFSEWNIDSSELKTGARVGIGSFGEVFRGVWRGTEVAIKILLEQDLTVENVEDFCNEISVLSRLRHPNVILFLGACTTPPRLSMVTEYMHMGSLYHLIHTSGQGKTLSWRRRLRMLCDICRGMMCIQRMNIVHRDLKSANCLVDKHWRVKICDFGLSRIMTNAPIKDLNAAGTPEWMAPELLRNEPFTEKCDVFSFGVIMWELCTLKRPWDSVKPMQVVYAVAHEGARLDIPDVPIGKLISDCWAEDPNARPYYEEIFGRLHECELSLN